MNERSRPREAAPANGPAAAARGRPGPAGSAGLGAGRTRRACPAALLAALLALAAGGERGRAYVPIRVSNGNAVAWDLTTDQPNVRAGKIEYSIHQDGTLDNLSGAPLDEFAAVQASFARWENLPGSTVRFSYLGTSALVPNGNDRQNVVVWRTPAQFSGLGPGVFAITVTTFETTGQITDADMILNENFPWFTSAPLDQDPRGTGGKADIENIVTHEAGHFLGLDHAYVGHSTMYAVSDTGFINLRSLEPDDRAGMMELYPGDMSAFGAITGQALRPPANALFGAHVIAIDATTLKPVAGMHALKSGRYTIRGLPPGSYFLFIGGMRKAELGQSYYGTITESFVHEIVGVDEPLVTLAGRPTPFAVTAGQTTDAGDHFCDLSGTPGEPDNTAAQAHDLELGQYAAAALDTKGDEDWYRLPPAAQDRQVVIAVDAWDLGSALDPVLTVYDAAAPDTAIAQSDDRDDVGFDLSGANVDPQIGTLESPYTVPANVTLLLKVSSFNAGSSGYYLVRVTSPGGATPDAARSTVAAAPAGIPALSNLPPGQTTSETTITVTLRNALDAPAAAQVVQVSTTAGTFPGGATTAAPVETAPGSGVFTVLLTAAATPAAATVSAVADGLTLAPVTVYFTGVPDAAQSTLSAAPLVLANDGAQTAVLTVQPRDALGQPLIDAGLSVAFSTGGIGTLLGAGATFNATTGAYEQALQSSTNAEDAIVTATLDAGSGPQALPGSVTVRFADDPTVKPDAAQSTIAVAPVSVRADRGGTATVTVTLRDAAGVALTGSPVVTVFFSDAAGAPAAGTGTLADAAAVLDGAQAVETAAGSGVYTATLGGWSAAGMYHLAARVGATTLATPAIWYVTGPPDAVLSTLAAVPEEAFSGGVATVELRLQPLDADGRPVLAAAAEVVFTASAGLLLAAPAVDSASGLVTRTLRASLAPADAIVGATVQGVTLAATRTVRFVADPNATPPAAPGGGGGGGGCGCGAHPGGGPWGAADAAAALAGLLIGAGGLLLARRVARRR